MQEIDRLHNEITALKIALCQLDENPRLIQELLDALNGLSRCHINCMLTQFSLIVMALIDAGVSHDIRNAFGAASRAMLELRKEEIA